jgi:hypothetical protein
MLKFGNREFNNLQEQVLVNANSIEEIKQSLGTALPNPIAGPQGPQGPKGPKGDTGTHSQWTIGTNLPASANLGDMHLLWNGDVYQYTVNGWVLELNIRGSQGVEGPRGFTGPKGDRGERGEQGAQGEAAPIFKVLDVLTAVIDLPDPETVATNAAYIVNNQIYGVVGNEWVNLGPTLAVVNAAGVVSEGANLVDAETVQEAINQLSNASYIYVEPYNEDYSSDVANHLYETTMTAEDALSRANQVKNEMPKTLTINGDKLYVGSYVKIDQTAQELSAFDTLRVIFTASKQLITGIILHPGVYFFRKTGIKDLNGVVDHVVFELAYNSAAHNISDRDVSVFIESYRSRGTTLGYRVSPSDNSVVHKTGNESISGTKTFTDMQVSSSTGSLKGTITTDDNYVYLGKAGSEPHEKISVDPWGNFTANSVYAEYITGQYFADDDYEITISDVYNAVQQIGDINEVLNRLNGEV